MSKFVFYQTINSDGSRTNHGMLLEGRAIQEALERIYARHEEAMSVVVLGTAECDRLIPVVGERGNNTPMDADDPDSAVMAIELDYPANLSEKAMATLKALEGTEALYYYMEHFIITDEGLDLNQPRWEGDTLEAMEEWLEKQADLK